MHKQDFLSSLEERLNTLPQLEKERILNYYNETLEDAIEDGLSESAAVASMDSLDSIVKGILEEHIREPHIENKVHEVKKENRTLHLVMVALSSPVWLFCGLFLCTLYCIYIVMLLALGILNLSFVLFALTGLLNLMRIIMLNFASGIVLLGCILFAVGLLPWSFKLLLKGIETAKDLYFKGKQTGIQYWRKAVAKNEYI